MLSRFVPPATVALLWFYEGLWCKVLGRRDDQRAIVDSVPFLPGGWTTAALVAIGLAEIALGLWVLSGVYAWAVAWVQTVVVAAFNFGGLLFGAEQIDEPGRLVVQDAIFLVLVWLVAARHEAANR